MTVPTVLFIDDDIFMCKALLRASMRLRPDWHYFYSDNASQWQTALPAGVAPDLVVSDYLMPELNGDRLLTDVMSVSPATVRVLMTGDTSEEVVSSVSVQAHFVLGKPFSENDLQNLFGCIERLRSLQLPLQLRQQLGRADHLPVLPAVIRKLRQEFSSESPDINQVVDLIAHEPVIAARLMQLANSAFLGFSRATHSLSEALMRLGLRLVEAIVTLMAVEQLVAGFKSDVEHQHISDQAFQQACTVRHLAHAAHLSAEQQDLLFVSALLSALGPLSKLQFAAQSGTPLPAQINGIDSSSVMTVYLLTLWGYPQSLCQLELEMTAFRNFADDSNPGCFILAVSQQYHRPCSAAYLQQMAAMTQNPGLKQALLQLPVLLKT